MTWCRIVSLGAVGLLACMAKGQAVPSAALPPSPLPGATHPDAFFPDAHEDPGVPTPESVLGFRAGEKPASHAQIEAVMKAIAGASPRCALVPYGTTHEGRTLWYLVIATPERIKDLEGLKASYAKLSDPRGVTREEGDALARSLPALAWMSYVIHGDENSGSDAAMAVAHHLAASTDEDVKSLLEKVVVIIDPLMNPDGRDRWLTMLAQNRTTQPSVDDQSLLHTGFWPRGRMNHYLFDMNRDWIFATQPETRGRLRAIGAWHPQYFMESHEMGSQDTFLFMPGREAINPNMPPNVSKWEPRFARDLAASFDARGWRYYTGEWNDNWYPGYSSSWAAFRGMIENLYEQANISTDGVRRAEGTIEPYREAVHKQLTATMANLRTLAANRAEVLADYLAEKRRCVGDDGPHADRVFAVVPTSNASRLRQFMDLLDLQGFESRVAGAAFTGSGTDRLGRAVAGREFPAGTVLISNRQPLATMVAAMLEFDPRMRPEFLKDERRELLRYDRSRIYDTTAWSIPMLFDLECCELRGEGVLAALRDAKPWAAQPAPEAVANPQSPVAMVIDGEDDASTTAAGRLMERGVWLRVANRQFTFGGATFARGSVLVTRKDNTAFTGDLATTVREVCAEAGTTARGITTGLGEGDLPDLGGEHFVLLQQPRIAVLGRDGATPYSFGQAWYVIDHIMGLRASYLEPDTFAGGDLRRYNVLVLPEGGGGKAGAKAADLAKWVEAGGTLIAIGDSAGALAKDKDGIGRTRLLPDVLAKPDAFAQAVVREWEARNAVPDEASVWAFGPAGKPAAFPWDGAVGGDDKPSDEELKRRDDWRKLFMPQGAILAARTDDESWLTAGCGGYVPVLYNGDCVLVSPPGVECPARLGVFSPKPPEAPKPASDKPADAGKKDDKKEGKDEEPKPGWSVAPPGFEMRLRMSGLLWPEAADRLANTAYVTRESVGAGQVILFATDPNFRAATLGTSRIFRNAIVYGPGMGASQPIRP